MDNFDEVKKWQTQKQTTVCSFISCQNEMGNAKTKTQPMGQIRPAKPLYPVHGVNLSIMKNWHIYKKFVDLATGNTSWNNHIT